MANAPDMAGWAIFFMGTGAILLFTVAWALQARISLTRIPHLTGRPAAPYWYTPTGRQDERGIVAIHRN
ncbi:MAG: hypothetical protein ACT4P1_14040 [Sporichthyaceae bacterium]